ncbi:peptidase MA family metallohydrolase, partial [Chloroflexota bacterium]
PLAESALGRISSILEVEFDGQMSIYLVPRLFWQGGAAYGEKVQLISYLDRNYTGIETWSYFTHEGTHALAQDLLQPKEEDAGPDGVLVEGLAVWASGGHYRQEPLDTWAAVVARSDSYVPLADLRSGPFYDFQHELSYLEAASFVKFLVEEYGLDRLKELYGQATGDAAHDEELVQSLYGQGYAELEADWLDYLDGLEPTPEQGETWDLTVRSFDLMRRYETELDPDARLLPPNPPPEWITDTLVVFLHRLETPANVALETALIAVQDRLYSGDLRGAAALLEDVEATLDAGTTSGGLNRPSLQARQALMELVAAQDRAILRADAAAYLDTVDPALRHRSGQALQFRSGQALQFRSGQASTLAQESAVDSLLGPPLTAFRQEVVRLDVAGDGASAEGMVLVHAQLAEGERYTRSRALADDGQLYAVTFTNVAGRWFMTSRRLTDPTLAPLPPDFERVP